MRLITWNVNGIRAVHRKGNLQEIFSYAPDILCLQETKAHEAQLVADIHDVSGYESYFESSKEKKGYSGVATYSARSPESVVHGLGVDRFDAEGRVLETYHGKFVLLNVYFPQGGGGEHRFQYKLDFYDAILERVQTLRECGNSVIICGDVNVAHEAIDLARPDDNHDHPCFRPEVREWIDALIHEHGFIDAYRHCYPNRTGAYTYWDMQTHARDRNVGWRIDYFLVTPDLVKDIKDVAILSDVYGSDHCPVLMDMQ
jgi:exodeoxyribonuclease-3